jgi:hypothetical protein
MSALRNLFACLALLLCAARTHAQSATPGGMPPPSGMSLAASAAMRFPQPVRVGDLIGRAVLRPAESQDVLGHVTALVRAGDGSLAAVVAFGGLFGFGSRPIAIPVDAMVLLGRDMEVVAFSPAQLAAFPTFQGAGATPVAADAIIRIGLAKPSH